MISAGNFEVLTVSTVNATSRHYFLLFNPYFPYSGVAGHPYVRVAMYLPMVSCRSLVQNPTRPTQVAIPLCLSAPFGTGALVNVWTHMFLAFCTLRMVAAGKMQYRRR